MRRFRELLLAMVALFALPALAGEPVNGKIHADQPGPVISRHIYGQFSEHLGNSIYDGVWVAGLPHPQHAWHPQ